MAKNSNFEVIGPKDEGRAWLIYLYDSSFNVINECEVNYIDIVSHSKPNEKNAFALTVGGKVDMLLGRPPRSPSELIFSPNLGLTVGLKFPHRTWRKTTYSIMASWGVRSVRLDTFNVLNSFSNPDDYKRYIAVHASVGVVVQHRKVQIGIFTGIDKISERVNQRLFWTQQGRSWYSLGIGYELFSTERKKKVKHLAK